MGILARLFLLVAVALAPVTAIQVYDELEHRRAREAELHAEAERLATLVGMEQDRVIEGVRQVLTVIAQLPSTPSHDPARGNDLLRRLMARFPYYAYLATMNLQGEILCSNAGPVTREQLLPGQPFFWAPVTTGDFAVGSYATMADGTRVLQLGYPVRGADGTPVGIAIAGLKIDRLIASLPVNSLPPDAVLDITDRNGVIIAHLPRGDGGTAEIGTLLPQERRALVHAPGLGSVESHDAAGHSRIFGFDPVEAPPGEGLYIEVGLDKAGAFAEIDRDTLLHGLAILAAVVSAGILAWFGLHYVVRRPVKTLLQAAQRWRRGDWTTRVGAADSGSEFGRLGHAFDRMAEAISQRETQLIRARDEAESANRAKSSFLANMSHELRTPLNAIIGFSEVLQDQLFGPEASERYREYGAYINASGQHLLRLVNDVLDLSKLAAGQLELAESLVDVKSLLHECIDLVLAQARQKSVTIATNLPADLPLVLAGELRLKQALLNLLSNAVKFSRADGTIMLAAQLLDTGELAITIADRGIGMEPRDIPVALEPFRQIDHALSRSYEGTGLGLPLAKLLVEKHGGTLTLESALGIGTTATVTLPRARLKAPAEALAAAQ